MTDIAHYSVLSIRGPRTSADARLNLCQSKKNSTPQMSGIFISFRRPKSLCWTVSLR